MTSSAQTKSTTTTAQLQNSKELPTLLVLLLASGAGLAVASIYYAQPILGVLGPSLGAEGPLTGLIPTLTQLGYALGILFLIPQGDRQDRRSLILIKAALLTIALLLSAMAPNIGVLLVTSLAIGLAATMAQDIVPAAAALAPASHRGKVVGTVMTGLLLGILLSRVVSGFVAEQWGWRSVFYLAAASIALIGLAAWRGLPRFKPTTQVSYSKLMASMLQLWQRYPELRRAAWAQGLLSLGFSAFWSTLAVMLHDRFTLGSAAAGAFGLAGVAGALAAPLAGHLADRRGSALVTRLGAGLAMASFAMMAFGPLLPGEWELGLIVAAAIGFDFGIQATLIAHQTLVYGLEPAARSRLNSLLFTGVFIGMASGSVLGSYALGRWGWMGVVVVCSLAAAGALVIRLRGKKR